jgi:NAD(P)-dependent dehydrogenase (short-subunit alcohol dehydrogenase family)
MTEVAGRVAVVTGGGSGIGRGLAGALAVAGAAVVVADLMPDRADAVANEIRVDGGTALGVGCDVCERASIAELKRAANDAFGRVSLLFANAGATSLKKLTDLSDDDVDWIVEVNLVGTLNSLRAFLPDMIAARDGHVVATASMAGLLPSFLPDHVPYAAAKAGIIGMMLNLRAEASEAGVGCTVLCPGGVTTRIGESSTYRPARFGGPFEERPTVSPELRDSARLRNLVFRPPEEVAQMVLAAVRDNRPMVVTDPGQRQEFVDGYASLVLSAFDDAAAYDGRTTSGSG